MATTANEILGVSPSMECLRSQAKKIARSEAPTLITGSTGTGKGHIASIIHHASKRAQRPFVPMNCAAIPDTLFESELFGFERGSFTGAVQTQRGKAALAHGGTLFLDEISELSTHCQAKLLRMLEEHEVLPIGASRSIRVDLRIIVATNCHVETAVKEHRFRDDLYYRINVARISIPDLVERPCDIPVYLDHFVGEFNQRQGVNVRGVEAELMDLLIAYSWPGNIREVRNFVEGVFIDPPDEAISIRHIPAAFAHLFTSYRRSDQAERQSILDALESNRWNKMAAAKSLNWSRMTLYRKLAKYGMTRESQSQVP